MKVKTISGSVYDINDHGICRKYNSDGELIDSFKVYFTKAIPNTVKQLGEIWDYPHSEPEVGKLLYIGGRDVSWLSTEVVSVVLQ